MGIKMIKCIWIFLFIGNSLFAQNTQVVHLNKLEQLNLQQLIKENNQANILFDSIESLANTYLEHTPAPLRYIIYEGRVDNDTARMKCEASLLDMDKISTLFYAYYGNPDKKYALKAKEFINAWVNTYEPNGNTINNNKFIPLIWGYYIFKEYFSKKEKAQIEVWMKDIACRQIIRANTPNNNWQAKRIRMLALVGGITQDETLMKAGRYGFQQYINQTIDSVGVTNDLKSRDALHYHVSGIKVLAAAIVNLDEFYGHDHLFDYIGDNGGSVKKAVELTIPYATGEKQHKEWVNSTVALDKKRAEAGIDKYQPGLLYNPQNALPLFEWAVFFQPDWIRIIRSLKNDVDSTRIVYSWQSMLNSPLVRHH